MRKNKICKKNSKKFEKKVFFTNRKKKLYLNKTFIWGQRMDNQKNPDKIEEISKSLAELFSKKIADGLEKRAFLRKTLDEQIEKLGDEEKTKIQKELGDFGTEADNKKLLENVFNEEVESFISTLYEKICVDDERLHNTLWLLGDDAAQDLKDAISNQNADYVNRLLSKFMFTFDDIPKLSDKDIQKLLHEIHIWDLPAALRIASEETVNAFSRNMTKNALKMLKEDMECINAPDKKSSRAAQRRILNELEILIDYGQISLPYYLTDYDENEKEYLRNEVIE